MSRLRRRRPAGGAPLTGPFLVVLVLAALAAMVAPGGRSAGAPTPVVVAGIAGDVAVGSDPLALRRGPAGLTAPTVVGQYDEDLRVDGATTYTVDLAARTIRVEAEVTLENLQAPTSTLGGTRIFFYTEFGFAVPAGATGLRAETDGVDQTTSITAIDEFFGIARVQLSPRLNHGTPRTYRISYDIVDAGVRTKTTTRVNAAFASFDLIPIGGPGTADVSVEIPDGTEVDFIGEQLADAGDGRYAVNDIAEPRTWFASVSIRDDDKLLTRTVELADGDVVVKAWPGDQEWSDFVADAASRGLPAIEASIGLPRPDTDDLTIIESAAPYLYGYAGWYLPDDDRIEVGDQLERQVVLHELTHIWFNEDLFDSRWINEGLAEVVSNRVMTELGDQGTPPVAVDRSQPGAQGLNEWAEPLSTDGNSGEEESYGYAASYAVIDRLLGPLEPDVFQAVLAAASTHEIAYVGSGEPERLGSSADWQTLLDYLDEIAGVADASAVFDQFVVADADRAILGERAVARQTYAEFVAASDGWAAPYKIREAMALWSFSQLGGRIDDARVLLDRRAALAELIAPLDVDVPDAVRASYEADDTDTATATFDRYTEVGELLVRADERADAGRGPLAAIGLLGIDVDGDVDAASSAFTSGAADRAEAGARDAIDAVDGATTAGVVRLVAVAGIGGAATGAVVARRRRRRVRAGENSLPLVS